MKNTRHFIIKISIIFIFLINITTFDSVSSQKALYGSESIDYVYSENVESDGIEPTSFGLMRPKKCTIYQALTE